MGTSLSRQRGINDPLPPAGLVQLPPTARLQPTPPAILLDAPSVPTVIVIVERTVTRILQCPIARGASIEAADC